MKRVITAAGLAALVWSAEAQLAPPRLEIRPPQDGSRWPRLTTPAQSNAVLVLLASTNCSAWQPIGTLHDALRSYPDPGAEALAQRFYRLRASGKAPSDDWKNQILCPAEAEGFRSTNSSQQIRWVKFAILLREPTRVYYQDSGKYLFHYDFAAQRLPPFLGMDYAAFNSVSLYRSNQQVVLGAVLYPPASGYYSGAAPEYGVQFVGLDPYTPLEVQRWFELVKATVCPTNGAAGAFYLPTFEQTESARTNAEALAALGVPVASPERWTTVNTCYSTGWALGRLKFFPAAQIAAACADGRLGIEDILLTDGAPADTPPLAGIVSLTAGTPNSHTALLCQSFGIPYVYLPDAGEQARVQAMDGHQVIVRASVSSGVAQVLILDVEGLLDPALAAELRALKTPTPIDLVPKEPLGASWLFTDTLNPGDIRFFGGKAANYGMLRRTVPSHCPPAIAFSFDLWDAFLDQALPGGSTLRAEIARRLAPFTNYPPDVVSLKTNLAAIRELVTGSAVFTPAQQQTITNALSLFDPWRKIRFRSSTNVEDTERFTGAGLYDSFSGCLADDLDGDTAGPSQCDPAETRERGVFRALRKVYASFYNDDAFLERLIHRVDESQVGMAVLVHHSFPDEEELANGVATPQYTFSASATNFSGNLVSQRGAESVTNPDGTAVPEVVSVSGYYSKSFTNLSLGLSQASSRVPLGAYVMNWPDDYKSFADLFTRVACGFKQFYPTQTQFYLDFEYKKDANLGLVLKQVRQAPPPAATGSTVPFLIDQESVYTVAQNEGANLFACHRLKSLWTLHTASLRLAPTNLVHGIYTQGALDYAENGAVWSLAGPLNTWPNASNAPSGAANYWTTGTGSGLRQWRLDTTLRTNVTGTQPPLFTQQDFAKSVTVTYATPQPTISAQGVLGTTKSETIALELRQAVTYGAQLQQRAMTNKSVLVQTTFYWPRLPDGGAIIKTEPLLRFVQTRITGLIAEPIVLTNYYSQTYHPQHHNFGEDYLFEPRLEPGLPADARAQLDAANIQLLYVRVPYGAAPVMYVLGLDQVFRQL